MGNYLPIQGDHLKKQRKKKGFTQKQVADIIGCTEKTYRSWEKGISSPETYYLIKLSELYDGVSTDYLLGLIKEKTHDIQFICEYTGLSEEAIMQLKDKENPCLSSVIEALNMLLPSSNFNEMLSCLTQYAETMETWKGLNESHNRQAKSENYQPNTSLLEMLEHYRTELDISELHAQQYFSFVLAEIRQKKTAH